MRSLREVRDQLVENLTLDGAAFGAAYAEAIDNSWPELLRGMSNVALVATGSYGRRELCPGSDIDAWLLTSKKVDQALAEQCWYPIWDSGIPLGHATRTLKEVSAAAEADIETLTAGLDLRHVVGDPDVTEHARERVFQTAAGRADTLIRELQTAVERRDDLAIAEMLEPDLKDGGGGLRDLDSLRWLDRSQQIRQRGSLRNNGYLSEEESEHLRTARAILLSARVALHRVTRSKSNLLALQEQDAVGALLGQSADELMRSVTDSARRISWITRDVFRRVLENPQSRKADLTVGEGIVLRDGSVAILGEEISDSQILHAAAIAAERGVGLDRRTMLALSRLDDRCVVWNEESAAAFFRLLRTGRSMVDLVEALDHVGVFTRFVPEWNRVRSLPQRNAYHRFTVDRHLLETIAESAALIDDAAARDQPLPQRVGDLLLMGALLHDLAKGHPEDHSVLGAELARSVGDRMGFNEVECNTLSFLVRHHLLLADTAVRRDLDDPATIERVGALVGDSDRLHLLLLLTLADSKATGPAAWSQSKISLMRSLAQRVESWLRDGRAPDRSARATLLSAHGDLLVRGMVNVRVAPEPDGLWECVVAAPDQRGLLAACAGALTTMGFDISSASGYSTEGGMALECFVGRDRFERLATPDGQRAAQDRIRSAIDGTIDLRAAISTHIDRYRKGQSDVVVTIDQEASHHATVVEVSADDVPGLLAVVAGVFSDIGLDVEVAKVATIGTRVVDVFYVRDESGKLSDRYVIERLRATLMARLASVYSLR